ncbi:MAG: hypothetical protein ACI4PQ_05655, partial [Butyricicoccaceae bacterium]
MERNEQIPSEEQEKIDLFLLLDDLWRVVKKFWLLIVIITVISAAVSLVRTIVRYTPRYEAYS